MRGDISNLCRTHFALRVNFYPELVCRGDGLDGCGLETLVTYHTMLRFHELRMYGTPRTPLNGLDLF